MILLLYCFFTYHFRFSIAIEIGIFYRTISTLEKERKIDQLISNWMSTHYEHKNLMDTIKELKTTPKSLNTEERSAEEIKKEWSRLSKIITGK